MKNIVNAKILKKKEKKGEQYIKKFTIFFTIVELANFY